jgi:hypothetical protein
MSSNQMTQWSKLVEVQRCDSCRAGPDEEPAVHLQLSHNGQIGDSMVMRLHDARVLAVSLLHAIASHGDHYAQDFIESYSAKPGIDDWRVDEGWIVFSRQKSEAKQAKPDYLQFVPTDAQYSAEPPHLSSMAGMGRRIRVNVQHTQQIELDVLGGYRYCSHVNLLYRTSGYATGRFILRLRHAGGVQLWERDRRFHLPSTDLTHFDQLAPGDVFKLGGVTWTKMGTADVNLALRQVVYRNRR